VIYRHRYQIGTDVERLGEELAVMNKLLHRTADPEICVGSALVEVIGDLAITPEAMNERLASAGPFLPVQGMTPECREIEVTEPQIALPKSTVVEVNQVGGAVDAEAVPQCTSTRKARFNMEAAQFAGHLRVAIAVACNVDVSRAGTAVARTAIEANVATVPALDMVAIEKVLGVLEGGAVMEYPIERQFGVAQVPVVAASDCR